jgi:hypothetical protein
VDSVHVFSTTTPNLSRLTKQTVAPLRFHGTPGEGAPVGMTKFESLSNLEIRYWDGGF